MWACNVGKLVKSLTIASMDCVFINCIDCKQYVTDGVFPILNLQIELGYFE